MLTEMTTPRRHKTETSTEEVSTDDSGLMKVIRMLNLPNNWLVVAIVLLSGGGNLLNTTSGNNEILKKTAHEEDVNKALQEIHELRAAMDGFSDRQKQILAALQPSPTPK